MFRLLNILYDKTHMNRINSRKRRKNQDIDHQKELAKAISARNQNKKLILFIGRGNKQGVADRNVNNHYCFLSKDIENFIKPAENESIFCAKLFDNSILIMFRNFFDEIIIDGGTAQHLISDNECFMNPRTSYAASPLFNFLASHAKTAARIEEIAANPICVLLTEKNRTPYVLLYYTLQFVSKDDLMLTFPISKQSPEDRSLRLSFENIKKSLGHYYIYDPRHDREMPYTPDRTLMFAWYLENKVPQYYSYTNNPAPELQSRQINEKDAMDSNAAKDMFNGRVYLQKVQAPGIPNFKQEDIPMLRTTHCSFS